MTDIPALPSAVAGATIVSVIMPFQDCQYLELISAEELLIR